MNDTDPAPIRRTTRSAARLTGAAGWSVIAIAVLHIAVFIPAAPWGDWLDGSLRRRDADLESVAVFWGLPGGLAVPMILLGLLLVRLGRQRQALGPWFPLAMLAWVSLCVWLVGPSGFLFVSVPTVLLFAAALLDRRSSVERV